MILSGTNNTPIKTNLGNFTSLYSRIFLITILIIWILGFLNPILLSQKNIFFDYFLTTVYSRVCHQVDYKCITIQHESMLVCSRCAGIYLGVLISMIFVLFHKIPALNLKVFVIATLPLITDVLLTTLQVYNYFQPLAFATGLLFGGMLCLFFLLELENIFTNKSIKRNE